ncbi:sensor histidine kinase [Planosporangium mesophilum]|uniref:histidine kinase n=1 Tax=Planosporangium mesophilum TaxID=689768 RepID=A0A8J3TGW2_9ACTN|nr:ATP-binding protein [Planosporangium mesophilum]NJC86566.1 HAMP domain-containing protein [Planosporangium mesophilum]GII26233.1 two-component sensor histidine kinase [Planosporangium mesophilum]
MRIRLLTLLLSAFGCILVLLGLAVARSLAAGPQQALFAERLRDATRFASAAQLAGSPATDAALREDVARYGEVYGVAAALLGESGQILISSRRSPDLTGGQARSLVRGGLAGHQSEQPPVIWPWDDDTLVVSVPVFDGGDVIGAVVIVSPTDRLRGAIGRDLLWLVVGGLTAMALLVLVASRLSTWVLRPVSLLDGAVHDISGGRLSARVMDGQGPKELRGLAQSFNRMADTVEGIMTRQREFAVNVSHQLRNPLAALMLRIDMLGLDLGDDRGGGVGELQREARHLQATLDELLRFATAYPSEVGAGPTDVTEVVAGRMAAWVPMADSGDVVLRPDWSPPVIGYLDPRLTASALDAVLDNAIKFSPPGGTVRVSVTGSADLVRVAVTDEGPGVPPEDLDRIGVRFWRGSHGQRHPGSGVGVSTARALLAAFGGTIDIAAGQPHGLRVTLNLPRDARPDGQP